MPRSNLNYVTAADGIDPDAVDHSFESAATVWQARSADAAEATVVIDDHVAAATVVHREATIVRESQATPVARGDRLPALADALHDAAAGPAVPSVRYVVVGTAGQGGMGTVHVARDKDLLRRVALKELSLDGAYDRRARTRFVREVQVTAQLDHPHIVPVYSLEVAEGGRPAYAMKLVEGRTFRELVDDTRAGYAAGRGAAEPLAARLEHFLKVCDAIDYAHTRGVVHRDLKPANLMLGRHNEVYVMDWGICRLLSHPDAAADEPGRGVASTPVADEDSTVLGTVVGTPMYMSPEQAQGRQSELDARSDLYALGLILYELVSLQHPFSGKQVQQILEQAAAGDRSPIAHAWHEPIPAELVAIIERATARDRARRYTGVGALADDLRRFLRGEAVEARPDSAWEKLVRRLARRRQAVATAVMAFALISAATVAALLWRHDRALERQQFREHYTQAFVDEVAAVGDRLQTRVLEVRGEVDALGAVVAQAAQHGREQPAGEHRTAGAPERGVFIVLPDGGGAVTASLEGRLHSVGAAQREIVERVRHALGSRRARGAGAGDETGLHRLVLGFDAGLGYVFPAAERRAVTDPRRDDWYRASETNPGVDVRPVQADGDSEHELAMSMAIRDDAGRAIGAVSLVLSLDNVLSNLLADSRGQSRVHGTWVLAHDGRVLAAHADTPEKAAALLRQVPMQDLLRAVASRDVGFVETTVSGAPQVVAFDRIHPFEWILLELAPESHLAARAARN